MRFVRDNEEEGLHCSSLPVKCSRTLYDQTKSPLTYNKYSMREQRSMPDKGPLCDNGQRDNMESVLDLGGIHRVGDHEVLTCYTDVKREQQLTVITNNLKSNNNNSNSNNNSNRNSGSNPNVNNNQGNTDNNSFGRKFNYSRPKVQSESQCQKTIEGCKMLVRPLDVDVIQQLWSKYQPPFELKASLLSQRAVKLHFHLTFVVLLILVSVLKPCQCSPAHVLGGGTSGSSDSASASGLAAAERGRDGRQAGEHSPVEFDRLEYLMRFGYLPMSYLETGALRSKEERDKSIEAFQKFANLPVTGRFDDATLARMMQPRCGVSDRPQERGRRHNHGTHARSRRYLKGPSKWHKNDLTYRILNYSPQLQQHEVTTRIRGAFRVWSRWVKLNFREVFSGHADILIKFARGYHGDGYPFDGPGLILAHAFFPGDDRGGDMHFDEDETWEVDSSGTDFFSVAVHEIGHSLGLAHSSVAGSLMYPWYQPMGFNQNFALHRDDIEGIQKLYDARDGNQQPDNPGDRPQYTVPSEPATKQPSVHIPPATDPNPTNPRVTQEPTPAPTPWGNQPPDPCTTNFDAITLFRNEIFMFKGKWFWRLGDKGIPDDYPVEIHRFFFGLPEDIEGFDAVYERPDDGRLVAFKGDRYWIFYGNYMDTGIPSEGRPLTDFGFPAELKKIDAAFIWGYNMKTYFISGDMYWKYFEGSKHMAHNYPRDMGIWGGVHLPVDTAFKDKNGTTFFFHKNDYYEFHDDRMIVRKGPKNLNTDWLKCKKVKVKEGNEEGNSDRQGSKENAGVSEHFGHRHGGAYCLGIIVTLVYRLLL